MIQFNKNKLNPVILNSTLSRGKLKVILDNQIKASNAGIFEFTKRTKKAIIAYYYCTTLGCFPMTSVLCTKHQTAVS